MLPFPCCGVWNSFCYVEMFSKDLRDFDYSYSTRRSYAVPALNALVLEYETDRG